MYRRNYHEFFKTQIPAIEREDVRIIENLPRLNVQITLLTFLSRDAKIKISYYLLTVISIP